MIPERPSDPPLLSLALPGGPLSYTDEGEGQAIVAVHGLPGSARDFRWLGTALNASARFIRLELPGFGQTPVSTGPSPTLEGRAAVVVEALDALGLERACILGHSMGGPVALAVAAAWPERVQALALLASVGLRRHRLLRRSPDLRLLDLGVRAPIFGRLFRPIYRRGLRALGFPGEHSDEAIFHLTACGAALSFETLGRMVADLRVPTYAASATDDPFIEPAIFDELSAVLPEGPRARWPTGGHNIQKSRALEIADTLLPWLAALPR